MRGIIARLRARRKCEQAVATLRSLDDQTLADIDLHRQQIPLIAAGMEIASASYASRCSRQARHRHAGWIGMAQAPSRARASLITALLIALVLGGCSTIRQNYETWKAHRPQYSEELADHPP